MNRNLLVVFNHFKLRMLHADPLSPLSWFSKNDQALTGKNHFLHVMRIKPAEHKRLTQSVRLIFLESCLEDLFAASKAKQTGFCYFAAKANRRRSSFPWKASEFAPVFMSPRIMS